MRIPRLMKKGLDWLGRPVPQESNAMLLAKVAAWVVGSAFVVLQVWLGFESQRIQEQLEELERTNRSGILEICTAFLDPALTHPDGLYLNVTIVNRGGLASSLRRADFTANGQAHVINWPAPDTLVPPGNQATVSLPLPGGSSGEWRLVLTPVAGAPGQLRIPSEHVQVMLEHHESGKPPFVFSRDDC